MEKTTKPRRKPLMPDVVQDPATGHLFDVVCTVGSVYAGDGHLSPHEAAFLLIAKHDAEGEYSFPMEDGGQVRVIVNYDGPATADAHRKGVVD